MARKSPQTRILAAALIAVALASPGARAGDTAAKAAATAPRETTRQCSMPTSPRLQKKSDDCSQAKDGARSYSSAELRDTGQGDMREALRRLDSAVR